MKARTTILTILLASLMGGCGVIDIIDAKLHQAGALPSASLEKAGIDPLAVVGIDADGEQGVGVVVDEGVIFAPYHVVRRAGTIQVLFRGHYRDGYHKEVEGRVIYRNAAADQCLIAVNTATPHQARLDRPSDGRAVMITLGQGRTNRFGRTIRLPQARTCSVDALTYTPDTPTRPGDSGGPILQGGAVVGLVRGPSRMVSTSTAMAATARLRQASKNTTVMVKR